MNYHDEAEKLRHSDPEAYASGMQNAGEVWASVIMLFMSAPPEDWHDSSNQESVELSVLLPTKVAKQLQSLHRDMIGMPEHSKRALETILGRIVYEGVMSIAERKLPEILATAMKLKARYPDNFTERSKV